MGKRAYGVIAVVAAVAAVAAVVAVVAVVAAPTAGLWPRASSEPVRAGIGELIARLPTPAQIQLRPLYVLAGDLRLEGQAVDEDKQPVTGARITLNGNRLALSAADGSFAFEHLAEGAYAVTAEHDVAYAEDTITLSGDSEPMELELKPGVGLRIHVETTQHRPIRDAAISIGHRDALTDGDGNAFVRGLDFDGERLDVSAAGYGPQRIEVATGDDPHAQLEQEVVLEPGAPFAGIVVDQAGKPAAHASVQLEQARWRDRIDADETGHFAVAFLGPGTVMGSAFSDDDVANPDELFAHDGVHPTRDIVIHVSTGARASGIVVDPSGNPIAKAAVRVGGSRDETDEHGHFKLAGIEPGSVDVSASSETMGAVTRTVQIKAGVPLELRIEMVVSSIAGIVRDPAGQPVEDATVWAAGKSEVGNGFARTDEHGRFDFGGLPPGEYEVSVQHDRDRTPMPAGVVVHTGTRNLALTVESLGGIAGRVFEHGAPVGYFGVEVSNDPEPSWSRTPDSVRDADGAFVQKDLPPGVYSVALIGAFQRKVIQNVRVREGGITQLGELSVEPGRVVRGIVHDDRGAPVAGAIVAVGSRARTLDDDSLAGKAAGTHVTRSDLSGRFEVVGLEVETLYVEATHDHDLSPRQELAADTTTVDLVIRRAGSLDGTIVHPRGRHTTIVATAVTDDTTFNEDVNSVGEFHFERLPAGDFTLVVHGEGAVPPQMIHVEAGATSAVSIELPARPIVLAITSPGCKQIRISAAGSSQGREECNDGVATFSDVAPGSYRVCADWEHCSDISVAASPSPQAATIQPSPPPSQETPAEPEAPAADVGEGPGGA